MLNPPLLNAPRPRQVINYDAAKDIDTHVHRIGRTGRAGDKEGVAYTLVLPNEARTAGGLATTAGRLAGSRTGGRVGRRAGVCWVEGGRRGWQTGQSRAKLFAAASLWRCRQRWA